MSNNQKLRALCLIGVFLLGSVGAYCQSSLSAGMDVNEITKRILSSTQYKLTPGDTYLLVASMGGVPSSFSLVLQENYELAVPYIGTLNVKGMYFAELRKLLMERLKKIMPMAEYLSVSLQSPARFDVTIYGGVEAPGVVTVSPLARVSDVVVLAKGIRKGASYRQILLLRGEKKIPIDLVLYGLLNEDQKNPTVEPGDSVYVPQTAVTVSITGQIRYPGIFELVPGDTIGSLMALAGGILAEAQPGTVEILRFNPDGTTSNLKISIRDEPGASLQNGDRLRIPSMTENKETVLVVGAVFGAPVTVDKPIPIPTVPVSVSVPYIPGITLLDVLEALGGPTPYAKAGESVVIRAATGQRILVDIETLWVSKSASADIAMEPGDSVSIPMILDVFVVGEVRVPGKVPYLPAFTVGDYIRAAGGVKPDSGDINAIFLVDQKGARTRIGLQDNVKPGDTVFADMNWWFQTQQGMSNILIITAFTAALIDLAVTILGLIP
jgi:protein involved in polysaccharide export with SLBB domain